MPRNRESPAPALPARAVERALSHIDAHLGDPLSAQYLAEQVATSPHHFHRIFSAHLGCSVGTYITWRRLQRAAALLASGHESVLSIALDVGFESGQSLAKAMRREWSISPTEVRRGRTHLHLTINPPWFAERGHLPRKGIPMVQLTRYDVLPSGLVALTATARGMVNHTMERSARQAFGELVPAIRQAGLMSSASSWIALCPDDAQGPDDPDCRYLAGVVFGYAMHTAEGQCTQPDQVALSGSLAWQPIADGRYAVFTHRGPYASLHLTWAAIYRDWLPASGTSLKDAPPLELMLNDPEVTPPEKLLTEIWIPLQ